jgi:hypothetical protein
MIKVIQLADDGSEMASIEIDDFTVEVVYSGLATMLQDAATARLPVSAQSCDMSRQALQRRRRVLSRLRD